VCTFTHTHTHTHNRVEYGSKYCITFLNADADAHVFHLHGHEMTTVETSSPTNRRGRLAAWRDSVVVPGGDCARRTVCFVAVCTNTQHTHTHTHKHAFFKSFDYMLTNQHNLSRFITCL
jgi:FtsP/CotA-like multicopper oxidase with cupredoxin domain